MQAASRLITAFVSRSSSIGAFVPRSSPVGSGKLASPALARTLFGSSGPAREVPRAPVLRRIRRSSWRDMSWSEFVGSAAMRRTLAVGGGAAAVAYVYTLERVPITGRFHNVALSRDAERKLGSRTYEQVKEEARAKGTLLPANHPQAQRVRRVGKRVAQAVERLRKHETSSSGVHHLKDLEWEFLVVASNQVNAFVVPGGKVCVFTGLMNVCRTDDEIATVLAHEAAHVCARHTSENLTSGALFTIMKVAVALLLDISLMGSAAISLLFELPMSRRNELEADRIGLSLMADACFDPRAAVRVYSKLGGADRQSKYFSTHPPSSDRVEQVRSLLPAAISHYDKKNCTARRRALAL